MKDMLDFFNDHEARMERKAERFPKCFECGEVILDEDCYEFEGDLFCEECVCKHHKKKTEDYMNDN